MRTQETHFEVAQDQSGYLRNPTLDNRNQAASVLQDCLGTEQWAGEYWAGEQRAAEQHPWTIFSSMGCGPPWRSKGSRSQPKVGRQTGRFLPQCHMGVPLAGSQWSTQERVIQDQTMKTDFAPQRCPGPTQSGRKLGTVTG